MDNTYYTIAVYDADTNTWSPEFGDFDRVTVLAEINEAYDPDQSVAVLATVASEGQPAIDAAIAKINGEA